MRTRKPKWNDIKRCILHLLHSCNINEWTYKEIAKFLNDPMGTIGSNIAKLDLHRRNQNTNIDLNEIDKLLKPHIKKCKILNCIVDPSTCMDHFESSEELKFKYKDRIDCMKENLF